MGIIAFTNSKTLNAPVKDQWAKMVDWYFERANM